MTDKLQNASLASGCFWCSEAVFRNLKGVYNVRSGFMGGSIKNPAYREVVAGRTGHAETVQFQFDPDVIGYRELLLIFFTTHDPTTLNRQGNDVGTHYRSIIFYHSEEQKSTAIEVVEELNREIFHGKIVTEIKEATEFFEAGVEHKNFYETHREYPYCQVIIDPKIKKLREHFSEKLVS
ncbi:MAG TPA: peptide-methionine (S)-S-oxide reductase MsrA [Flavobacteriaceae bacterium]|nr:peptide-methionine (S)-S-oxide reductase MsrA [Flavobacteriaceae bacterium]